MTELALNIRSRIHAFVPSGRANFWLHITEGVFFSFGAALVQGPVFAFLMSGLGVSPTIFGFLSMFNGLAILLPLVLAPRVEAAPRKKRLVLQLGIGQRLPFLIIPFLLLLFSKSMPTGTAILIASVNFVASMMVSVLVAPWMALVAETIGPERVGRLFGYRHGTTNVFKLISAGACAALLSILVFPRNYVVLYFAAFVSVAASWLIFGLVDEMPARDGPARRQPLARYFGDLGRSVKQNRDFRVFLIYRAINRLGFAATPFYAFTASSVFDAPPAYAGYLMGVSSAAGIMGCFLLPHLGDRVGHKAMLTLGSLLHISAALVAAFSPNLVWFFGVIFLSALGGASLTVSGMAFLLPMAPKEKRIGYITGMNAVMAPVGMLASASAGFAMERLGHQTLFCGAAALLLLSLIPLARCGGANEGIHR